MKKAGRLKLNLTAACVIFSFVTGGIVSEGAEKKGHIPHLRKQGEATQLIVDDKPFLIIGGELGNSTASSPDGAGMKTMWQQLAKTNLNTVLAPVYWDLIEPQEGRFDFTLVDDLIKGARRHNMRLILLWFGSWKNSMSCYVPYWVKKDYERFPRARDKSGRGLEMLTAFSEENLMADANAFASLMRHIRRIDGGRRTVIMVQVENEPGMTPDAKDHCPAANEQFDKPVPKELVDYLQEHKESLIPEFYEVWKAGGFKTSGTWEEVFGGGVEAEEIFMAWHYARYIGRVAKVGKAEYALPMFVNAALIRPNYKPGQYPSAGPLPHLMDVWRAGGPEIDFLAPDIYFPNFVEWVEKYHRSGNPLFIPETGRGAENPANAFYAFGRHDAMGFSPFAIEGIARLDSELAQAYGVLRQLSPMILEKHGTGAMTGVVADFNNPNQQVCLGEYKLNIKMDAGWGKQIQQGMTAGCIIISTGPDDYVIAGKGLVITFEPNTPGDPIAGIGSIEQGEFVNGRWKTHLWLNGDQSHQGRHLRLPMERYEIQRVKLYRYH
jgi:beta-galactosidase GanA